MSHFGSTHFGPASTVGAGSGLAVGLEVEVASSLQLSSLVDMHTSISSIVQAEHQIQSIVSSSVNVSVTSLTVGDISAKVS